MSFILLLPWGTWRSPFPGPLQQYAGWGKDENGHPNIINPPGPPLTPHRDILASIRATSWPPPMEPLNSQRGNSCSAKLK